MYFLKKLNIALIILFTFITFTQAETSWITKKKDKDKTENTKKVVEKKSSEWIKKKEVKENKKKYKSEEKKITKEVKSWITKKSKDKYIKGIENLPDAAIYFTASNEDKSLLVYGYVLPDTNSKLISGYYETSKGFGYFNDGKTTCKLGSTIIHVSSGEVTARVSGECTDGTKFAGKTSQTQNSGDGYARTKDGKDKFFFDFNIQKAEIAKIFENNLELLKNPPKTMLTQNEPFDDNLLDLEITGKYYALLIGNSNYEPYAQWASLNSPKNDVLAISKVLKNKFKFEKVITVVDANKQKIIDSLNELADITTDTDYVLIYYSGHGERISNSTYWIPIDGPKKWRYDSWISISEISNFIENINAHDLVLMVDSCYTGSAFKGTNVDDLKTKSYNHFKQLAQKLLDRRSRYVLSSGGNEPVDDTFDGKHSIFAKSFLNSLETAAVINMESIYRIIDRAHGEMDQRPYLYSPERWGHGGGDFIFVSK